jgi:hypothetical protein
MLFILTLFFGIFGPLFQTTKVPFPRSDSRLFRAKSGNDVMKLTHEPPVLISGHLTVLRNRETGSLFPSSRSREGNLVRRSFRSQGNPPARAPKESRQPNVSNAEDSLEDLEAESRKARKSSANDRAKRRGERFSLLFGGQGCLRLPRQVRMRLDWKGLKT